MIGDDKYERPWHRLDRTDSEPVHLGWSTLLLVAAVVGIILILA